MIALLIAITTKPTINIRGTSDSFTTLCHTIKMCLEPWSIFVMLLLILFWMLQCFNAFIWTGHFFQVMYFACLYMQINQEAVTLNLFCPGFSTVNHRELLEEVIWPTALKRWSSITYNTSLEKAATHGKGWPKTATQLIKIAQLPWCHKPGPQKSTH